MQSQLIDCSLREYHQRPEISSGAIRCFARDGPLVYQARYLKQTLKPFDSDAMVLGRAFHSAIEHIHDDDQFEGLFVLPNKIDGEPVNYRKPAHRAWRDELLTTATEGGLEVISQEQLEQVRQMVKAVEANELSKKYLDDARHEQAAISLHEATDLPLKALADIWIPHRRTLVDFKTTRHSTRQQFMREAIKLGYHFQMAHYREVFGALKAVIITVRNEEPYEALVYVLSDELLDVALEANNRVLQQIRDCMDWDSWHTPDWNQEVLLEAPYYE